MVEIVVRHHQAAVVAWVYPQVVNVREILILELRTINGIVVAVQIVIGIQEAGPTVRRIIRVNMFIAARILQTAIDISVREPETPPT